MRASPKAEVNRELAELLKAAIKSTRVACGYLNTLRSPGSCDTCRRFILPDAICSRCELAGEAYHECAAAHESLRALVRLLSE